VVEGTGLENRRTGNGIVSSNLTLSAHEFAVRMAAATATTTPVVRRGPCRGGERMGLANRGTGGRVV
jgi:hypothetical protein